MECHHRLAGARPTLDDENAGLGRANDLVLLALDRRHDVAELPGTAPLERRDQCGVPADTRVATDVDAERAVRTDPEMILAEQFVLDAEQLSPVHRKVSASHEAHRVLARGTVKGFCHRGTPVHNDGLMMLVGNRQPTDVERLDPVRTLCTSVDTAEDQCIVTEVEIDETLDEGLVEHIPLVARLERATPPRFGKVTKFPCLFTTALEAVIGMVYMCLFVGEIRVLFTHRGDYRTEGLGGVLGNGLCILPAHLPGPLRPNSRHFLTRAGLEDYLSQQGVLGSVRRTCPIVPVPPFSLPPTASPPTEHRCGSCARQAAICRNTGR